MTEAVGWVYPQDESDQWDGFNEPGIEHFRGSPLPSLAREIVQNSLDAKSASPVEVSFKKLSVPRSSIPGLEELVETFKACQKIAPGESEKAEAFFLEAMRTLSKKKISVLQVADRNTTGMKGPCEYGTPFFAFMKASGQSVKEGPIATGSYGIGKSAPFAVSALRTVFVSTAYRDEDEAFQCLSQGKSILMSHDVGGKRRRGHGFWGIKDHCKPIQNSQSSLPEWLQPCVAIGEGETGTVLGVLGFDEQDSWKHVLAASIAENFFGAILRQQLVVRVDGEFVIDSSTLGNFLTGEFADAISSEKGEPERIKNCELYLAALQQGGEVIEEAHENRELGFCKVRILLGEGLPKRVCTLRNGMFITDQLDGLKRFSEFKEFVAVVECDSRKGNELLRNMEPPKHDDFEPHRLPSSREVKRGRRALKTLTSWVRDMLRRHAKDPVSDVTSIDELSEYFGDDRSDEGDRPGEEMNPEGSLVITAKPLPRKSSPMAGREGSQSYDRDRTGGSSGGREAGEVRDGDGRQGGESRRTIPLENVRAVPVNDVSRRVSFTPTSDGSIRLRIEEAGADIDFPLTVVSASEGDTRSGVVEMSVRAGQRKSLTVELGDAFNGAVRVVAYEV